MAKSQPITVDGVDYPSKKAAIWALFEQGDAPEVIASKVDLPRPRVVISLSDQKRAKGWVAPPVVTQWTEAKVDTAVRLFPACLDEVARHLDVPSVELRDLWVKGKQPALPPAAAPDRDEDEAELARLGKAAHCSGCGEPLNGQMLLCDIEDGSWCGPCFDKTACGRGEHGEGCSTLVFDVPDEPTPDNDETEEEETPHPPSRHPLPQTEREERSVPTEAPAFQASRFPDPPAAAPAGATASGVGVAAPGQVLCLMDEMGRYLHESLDGMTTNPRFAWKGGADKLALIQKRLPHLRQLDPVGFVK